MIRVILAEDHALVRRAFVQLLSAQSQLSVVAEAATVEDVLTELSRHAVDLLLLDLNMPGESGVPLIERLLAAYPALRILVLSMTTEGAVVSRALRAGAAGYVTKDSDIGVLLQAIRKVAGGGRYVDPALVDTVLFHREQFGRPLHESLSAREREVLRLIVNGHRLNDIAEQLQVSAKTVSTHKMNLMNKLHVENNAELLQYAVAHKLGD